MRDRVGAGDFTEMKQLIVLNRRLHHVQPEVDIRWGDRRGGDRPTIETVVLYNRQLIGEFERFGEIFGQYQRARGLLPSR